LSFYQHSDQNNSSEYQAVLVDTDEKWLEALFESTHQQVLSNRAALVLCETIHDAEKVCCHIKNQKNLKIKQYFKDDARENEALSDLLSCQEVILATNLAGRGADIKTSPLLEAHDGMHVTVSFLPDNDRIEQQAFGRTSRQGKREQPQLIIHRGQALKNC
jgi:preprotein translocase subunit SecA